MAFQMEEKEAQDVKILALTGDLDARALRELQKTLLPLLGQTKSLLVDCADLTSITGEGLRALVMAGGRLEADDGAFALSGLQPQVHRIFEVARMEKAVEIHDSRRDAITAIRDRARTKRHASVAASLLRQGAEHKRRPTTPDRRRADLAIRLLEGDAQTTP